jgi:hypothetical protein
MSDLALISFGTEISRNLMSYEDNLGRNSGAKIYSLSWLAALFV